MKDWIIFLDAKVENGMCYEVSYFSKSKDKYSLVWLRSTYGGWGFGPPFIGCERSIYEFSDYSWSLSSKKCQKVIADCCASMKSGRAPQGYLQIEPELAYSDFFGDVNLIQGKLGEAIRKIQKRT